VNLDTAIIVPVCAAALAVGVWVIRTDLAVKALQTGHRHMDRQNRLIIRGLVNIGALSHEEVAEDEEREADEQERT
jgi:kynurenine formamidase